MEKPRQARIPCVVSKGMFENEFAAEIAVPGDSAVSLFVDERLVRMEPGTSDKGSLLVTVVPNGAPEGWSTILLPAETFESGNRWLHLPTDHLQPE
jgi:hypothetical protein